MGDMLGVLKGTLVNFVVKYVKKMVPKYSIDNFHTFEYFDSSRAFRCKYNIHYFIIVTVLISSNNNCSFIFLILRL